MTNKKFISAFISAFILIGIGLIGGFLIGMIAQQIIMTSSLIKIASAIEGNNIEVNIDINETLMMDKIHENFKEMGVYDDLNKSLESNDSETNEEELKIWFPKENIFSNPKFYNITIKKSHDYYGECYENIGDNLVGINMVVVHGEQKKLVFECGK